MWTNPQETADLIKFTEEILNGKLHFLCSVQRVVTSANNHTDVMLEYYFYNMLICRDQNNNNNLYGTAAQGSKFLKEMIPA